MLENYMIYAKDVMNFLTERGYKLGYTRIVGDSISKNTVCFYYKGNAIFKLVVNNLFLEEIVNCNSKSKLSAIAYPQGVLLQEVDKEIVAGANELQPATIYFTFTGVLFKDYDNLIEKYNSFMTGYRDFATDFAALFEEELRTMKPAGNPVAEIKMFDVFQKGDRLFWVSGKAGAAYELTLVFDNAMGNSEILGTRELTDGFAWAQSALPSSECVNGVINFLAFALNKDVLKMAVGDFYDENAFSGLPVPPVEFLQLVTVKVKSEYGGICIEISESQEYVLNVHVDNILSYCSWNIGTDRDYRYESYNVCFNKVVHYLTKNNGIQGFASGAAVLIATIISILLPFLAQKPEILNYLVSVNNFYVGMAKGENVELEENE